MSPIRPENRGRYPADWPEISRAIKGAPAYGTGSTVVLTTAHLDHTPENCDGANLRAMCQGCHLHYDRGHHAETRARTRAAELEAANEVLDFFDPASWRHP